MDIARDIIARTDQLATDRTEIEREWLDLADYCLPSQSRAMRLGTQRYGAMNTMVDRSSTREASRKRFDSTAITAIDRLSAGMESLVSPQSEKWAELGPTDPLAPEPTDPEAKWYERLRDYQFGIRYTPLSGFGNANQKYIRSICTFGTGVVFVEESFGKHGKDQRQLPVTYQHVPLAQCLIAVDAQGNPDTLHRRFARAARQCLQKWGDRCSAKVKEMAADEKRMDQMVDLIHAVYPRSNAKPGGHILDASWASFYVEVEGQHLIGESGFHEFPFAIGYWTQTDESAYGESAAMAALDDIRGLNVKSKSVTVGYEGAVRPPLAIAHDGIMGRPNINPGAVNFGAIDANGRMKIQRIDLGFNPQLARDVIKDAQNAVKELLYNNLFQILVQNPQMTAHEAMLRAAEKGDLLGPNGVKIQQGYASISDREIGILERKGAFRPGAALEPPSSLRGRSFGARFTSTLDRLRESKDAAGIMSTYQAAGQIASLRQSPDILDNLDDDLTLRDLARINGMPQRLLVDMDAVKQARAQRQKMMQAQQALMAASSAAATAKDTAAGEKSASDAKATQVQSGTGSPLAALGGGPKVAPGLTTAPLPLPQLVPSLPGGA